MATGVAPANSYRVLLDPDGGIVWETARDGEIVSYQDEPDTPSDRLASLTQQPDR